MLTNFTLPKPLIMCFLEVGVEVPQFSDLVEICRTRTLTLSRKSATVLEGRSDQCECKASNSKLRTRIQKDPLREGLT